MVKPEKIKNQYDETACHLLMINGKKILEMKSNKPVRIEYESLKEQVEKSK